MNEPVDPKAIGSITSDRAPFRQEEPLLFEPLKAFRHWRISGNRIVTPIHGSYRWTDGENIALCEANGRLATECLRADCACGFYSVWSAGHQYGSLSRGGYVCGVVELYGRVVVGPEGARSSKARIAALYLPTEDSWSPMRRSKAIRRRYPTVRFYRNKTNMVTAEQVTRPDHLIYPKGRYY